MMNRSLLTGLILSVAIHGAALYSRGIYTPAEPRFDAGRTVVQLTLLPSVSRQAATPPPAADAQPELLPEPEPLPEPFVAPEAAVIPLPVPEPVRQAPAPVRADASAPPHPIDSAAQDASVVEDKGVITEAMSTSSIQPVYPRVSRLRGEEGVVTLLIQVLPSGKPGRVDVLESSGYHRLDEAACKAARRASFTPARQFGRDIDSTTELSFTFRLTHD